MAGAMLAIAIISGIFIILEMFSNLGNKGYLDFSAGLGVIFIISIWQFSTSWGIVTLIFLIFLGVVFGKMKEN